MSGSAFAVKVLAVPVVVFLLCDAAVGADVRGAAIPSYDVEKLCSSLAAGAADPRRAEYLCSALENQQRGRIAHQNVTESALRKCLEEEKLGSYFSLNTCLNEASKRLTQENVERRAQHKESRGVSIPKYDIGAYCRRAVKAFNGSGSLELDCRMKEQDALRQILRMDAEEKVMRLCARTTDSVKGGYVLLRDCLVNEQKKEQR